MAGIDASSCNNSTLDQLLPREMWVKILDYVPLKQRLAQVQFTCQMFAGLCNGQELTGKLDFEDCVYMPDELCVGTLTKTRDFVRYLSFRECTWFSDSVFTEFPTLNRLVTLDLTGIRLTVGNFIILFQSTPALQNLSLTISESTLFELTRYLESGMMHLKSVHIEVLRTTDCDTPWAFEVQHFDKFIESWRHEEIHSVLIIKGWYPFFGFDVEREQISPTRNRTIHRHGPIDVDDYGVNIIRDILENSGLHCIQVDSDKRQKLDDTRYLSLPAPFSCDNTTRPCVCDGVSVPASLPALQYLSIAPFFECNSFKCFSDTNAWLLFECEMPELTHLHFSFPLHQHARVPAKIYQRLASFVNLIELNLASLLLDLFTLMDGIKNLNQLRGLAFSVNESIMDPTKPASRCFCHGQVMTGVSSVFFSRLVTTFPNLEKLELQRCKDFCGRINTKDLIPISSLTKLKHLIINELKLINTFHFEEMCRNFRNIRSLILSAASREVWECANVTKGLHFMQQLAYIRLSLPQLPIFETFKQLHRCKHLRKIFIISRSCVFFHGRDNVTVKNMTEALDALLHECKRLCVISIFCEHVNDTLKVAVSQYERNMRTNGRNIVISLKSNCEDDFYCDGYLERRFSSMSEVATCSPFDLFVA